eukprot:1867199-Prymnesium_polylepis.1
MCCEPCNTAVSASPLGHVTRVRAYGIADVVLRRAARYEHGYERTFTSSLRHGVLPLNLTATCCGARRREQGRLHTSCSSTAKGIATFGVPPAHLSDVSVGLYEIIRKLFRKSGPSDEKALAPSTLL